MVSIVVRVDIDVISPRRKEGGYEMPKRYVLRCERNWVLESESGKEEH